jgi:hypothetical protein
MSTNKFAISSRLLGSLILSTAMFFILGSPLSAQTSETSSAASESSEPSSPSHPKDPGKAKHAAGSFSVDQVPDDAVPCKDQLIKNDQLIKLLHEQNTRLKAENARLKAEIAELKAKK